MRFVKFTHAGAALVLGLLSACTVVVDDDRPGPGPRPLPPGPPPFCTREYEPVCGVRGRQTRVFNNQCLAEAAGYEVRVGLDSDCRVPGPRPRPGPGPRPDFCTREYAPVCGRRGPEIRTFGNECEAESRGYRVIDDGPC